MPGEWLTSPRVLPRSHLVPLRGVLLILGVVAVVAVLVLGSFTGVPGPLSARGARAFPGARVPLMPASSADFKLVNFTANNTTVDVSMAFNLSVDVVNLTNGAINSTNTSNWSFAWTGLPAFVPSVPGSGCVGVSPVNGSLIPNNDSSLLDCSAASATSLSIQVTATNLTSTQSNSSGKLAITVNSLVSLSSFSVSKLNSTLGTQIWFNATSSGGTAPVTFSYSGLPLGCTGSSTSFSCTPTRAGVYTVTVKAVDMYGYTSKIDYANVSVSVPAAKSPGIGTTGWGIVIGILVVGFLATGALFYQARREERAGRMGMEGQVEQEPPSEMGGTPPMGGPPPPPSGPSS